MVAAPHPIPPGPRGWPLVGSLPALAQDLLGFWTGLAERHGDIARYRAGAEQVYLVSDPDAIARVFQHDNALYTKGKYHRLMRSAIGDGLLVATGERWQTQRRRLQPVFAKNRVATWFDIVTDCTQTLLDGWERSAGDGRPVDIAAAMMELVQTMIVKMLFGRGVDYRVSEAIVDAVEVVNDHLLHQVLRETVPGGVLNRLPLPSNRRYRRAVAALRGAIEQLIAAPATRHAGPADDDAVIRALRRERMDDTLLRDELITLFLAGHETTACVLAWAFYYLTEHPAVAERVAAEVASVSPGAPPDVSQLPALPLTRQVVDEAMRLMPPVYGTGRTVTRDHELGGYHARAGTLVIVSQYVMHRHPAHWDAPNAFDPGRWAGGCPRHRYAYFPFGGGPRTCVGLHLAMLEMLTVVAMVLQRFRLTAAPGRRVKPRPMITLRPTPGVPVTLLRR